eukprot:TRINITY_DN11468_c0_g1_i1.p1 TRINITY_DN11468_c0_g1~~TRINITY_DN11468_c0_g1_i1.p1  ORF type:complete len:1197 (+),score=188.10 TRINITY_DN11468_c0_g1_i1:42-3632(+)
MDAPATHVESLFDLPRDAVGEIFRSLPETILGRFACANKFLSSEVWALQHSLNLRHVGLKTLDGDIFQNVEAGSTVLGYLAPIARPSLFPQRSLLPIARCTNLRSLQVDFTSRIEWSEIALLTSLQSLIIDSVPSQASFVSLSNLTNLQIGLSTHAESQISPLTALRKLSIRGIQDCGVFASFKRLKHIVIDDLLPDASQLCILCSLECVETICTRSLVHTNTFSSIADFWRFEIISQCPRPIRFLTSSGETYWAAFASSSESLWTPDRMSVDRRGPKQELIDIFTEAAQKYKCESLNINAVGLGGKTALHAFLILALGDPTWLLERGADASIMMPISACPPLKRFAKQPDGSDAGTGVLPFLYSIACGFSEFISTKLWDATPEYRNKGPITPLIAAVLNAKPSAVRFALRDPPLECVYALSAESGFVPSNAIFEAVRIGNGRNLEILLAEVTDDQLAAIADHIDAFFSTRENGTTMLHLLMQADKHTLDSPTPTAPGSDTREKTPIVFGSTVISRLVKYVKNLWAEDAQGRYPLDVWLSTSASSYLPEFAVAPEMFWRLRKESPTGPHAPICQLLSVRRGGLDHFIKALVDDAKTRENGISQLFEDIILDSDPFVIRYIVSGCHGPLMDIASVRSTECAKMCPFKPSDMELALEKCLSTPPKQKIPEFHYNFNLWVAMGVEATRTPEFAYRVFSLYGTHYDSVDDLRIMLEFKVPFTHPDLFARCLQTCNLETCSAILREGAPIGTVQPCDIPTPKLAYEFAGFSSLVNQVVEKGGDLTAPDRDGKTLLKKLQLNWFNASICDAVPTDPVALLRDPTHQRLRFLVQLANKGAPWKKSIDLVYFAIVAGGGISDIRTLLSQAGKGLDGSKIWRDFIYGAKTKSISDFALGLICDLLIEFEVTFEDVPSPKSVRESIYGSRHGVILKLLKATHTHTWAQKQSLAAAVGLALFGLIAAADLVRRNKKLLARELVQAVANVRNQAGNEGSIVRVVECPELRTWDGYVKLMEEVIKAFDGMNIHGAQDLQLTPDPPAESVHDFWTVLSQEIPSVVPHAPITSPAEPFAAASPSGFPPTHSSPTVASGLFQVQQPTESQSPPTPSFSSPVASSPSLVANPFAASPVSVLSFGDAPPVVNPFQNAPAAFGPQSLGSSFGNSAVDPFAESTSPNTTSTGFALTGFSTNRSGGKKTPTKWPRKK